MADWLERYRIYVFITLLDLVVIGLAILWIRRPQPAPMRVQLPPSETAPPPAATATIDLLRVYVCGAVKHADVYTLTPGAIVKDAILAAGGPTDEADLTLINLALPVRDSDQIYVPKKGEEKPTLTRSFPEKPSEQKKVNINEADINELQTLPGIGPTYAQRIVEYRQLHGPFQSVDDLERIQGIGPATLQKIRDLVTVR